MICGIFQIVKRTEDFCYVIFKSYRALTSIYEVNECMRENHFAELDISPQTAYNKLSQDS